MQILVIIASLFSHHKEVKPVIIGEGMVLTQGFEAIYIPEDAEAPFVAIPADERVF
jgi:hypothetical protein